MILNVNHNEVVRFTATLERLMKHALPSAVRSTLNDAALDVKQKTMPIQAKAQFINRSPNFFRANSSVDFAKGIDVNRMISTVGFTEAKLRLGNNNFSVRDLEDQERGGTINKKDFIPLDSARQGGYNTLVKPVNRLSKILKSNRVVVARNIGKGTKKEQFIKAIHKTGVGGYVIGSNIKGENLLWRVDDINGENRFSLTPLYTYKKGRKVAVKETSFMKTATLKSAIKLNDLFISNAKFWINKYKK